MFFNFAKRKSANGSTPSADGSSTLTQTDAATNKQPLESSDKSDKSDKSPAKPTEAKPQAPSVPVITFMTNKRESFWR